MHSFAAPQRLGIDIGGTFTDIVLVDADGAVTTRKVPSTPDDYARGIVAGLQALQPAGVAEVVHGTTVATNAILEHRAARTGLITTEGFRDVLEIGRLRYPRLYDLSWEKPLPLVPRRWRREVGERVAASGEVVRRLDPVAAREVLDRLLQEDIEALAICLINSYVNPDHERQLGELARQLAPDLPVSLSCEVLPEIKEYERTSTTVINAALQPLVGRYLESLSRQLARAPGLGAAPLYVMQSSGGIMSAAAAAARPMHILESGPAAGVIGALTLAKRVGLDRLLTLDMGGTTAKAALIEEGQVARSPEYQVGADLSVGARLSRGGGYPLRVPAIDIAEVGAGGGSIVRVDRGGALRVGPESAGAAPGPACYGEGGTEPTLTDANVVLGYLNPEYLAGGALRLDPEAAHRALRDKVAAPLGLELAEAVHGVFRIAGASMGRAARAVSIERGRDPREFVLCAFGGSGPLQAVELAGILGMKRVLVPPAPGLFSAFGLLCADMAHHLLQTYKHPLDELDPADLVAKLDRMATDAREELAATEGDAAVEVTAAVELRYVGQTFELGLPLREVDVCEARRGGADFSDSLATRFGAEHQRTYGHSAPDDPIEVVNLRLTAVVPRSGTPGAGGTTDPGRAASTLPDRSCYFGPETGWIDVPVMARPALDRTPQPGPLIVEEYDATILVPPAATAARDEWGNVVIETA